MEHQKHKFQMEDLVVFKNKIQDVDSYNSIENNEEEEKTKFEILQLDLQNSFPQKQQQHSPQALSKQVQSQDTESNISEDFKSLDESQTIKPPEPANQSKQFTIPNETQENKRSDLEELMEKDFQLKCMSKTDNWKNLQKTQPWKNNSIQLPPKRNVIDRLVEDSNRRRQYIDAIMNQNLSSSYDTKVNRFSKSSSQKSLLIRLIEDTNRRQKSKKLIETSNLQTETSQLKKSRSLSPSAVDEISFRMHKDFRERQLRHFSKQQLKTFSEDQEMLKIRQKYPCFTKADQQKIDNLVYKLTVDAKSRKAHKEKLEVQKSLEEQQLATILRNASFTNKKSKQILDQNEMMKIPVVERFTLQIQMKEKQQQNQKEEMLKQLKEQSMFKARVYKSEKISQETKHQRISSFSISIPQSQSQSIQKENLSPKNQSKQILKNVNSNQPIILSQTNKVKKQLDKVEMINKQEKKQTGIQSIESESPSKQQTKNQIQKLKRQSSLNVKPIQGPQQQIQRIKHTAKQQPKQKLIKNASVEQSVGNDFKGELLVETYEKEAKIEAQNDRLNKILSPKSKIKMISSFEKPQKEDIIQISKKQKVQIKSNQDKPLMKNFSQLIQINANKQKSLNKSQKQEEQNLNIEKQKLEQLQLKESIGIQRQEKNQKGGILEINQNSKLCYNSYVSSPRIKQINQRTVNNFQKNFQETQSTNGHQTSKSNDQQTEKKTTSINWLSRKSSKTGSDFEAFALDLKLASPSSYKYKPLGQKISEIDFHNLRKKL